MGGSTCVLPSSRGFAVRRGGVPGLLLAVERDERLELRLRLPSGDDCAPSCIDERDDGLLDVRDGHLMSSEVVQGIKTFSRFRDIDRFTTRGLVSLVAISS